MSERTFAVLDRLGEVRERAWKRLDELSAAVQPVQSFSTGVYPFAVYLRKAQELARVDPRFAYELEKALRKLKEVRDGR